MKTMKIRIITTHVLIIILPIVIIMVSIPIPISIPIWIRVSISITMPGTCWGSVWPWILWENGSGSGHRLLPSQYICIKSNDCLWGIASEIVCNLPLEVEPQCDDTVQRVMYIWSDCTQSAFTKWILQLVWTSCIMLLAHRLLASAGWYLNFFVAKLFPWHDPVCIFACWFPKSNQKKSPHLWPKIEL